MRYSIRKIKNSLATLVFSVGGISVILIICLLIFFLVKEIFPLFSPARILDQKLLVNTENAVPSLLAFPSENANLILDLKATGKLSLIETATQEEIKSWQLQTPVANVFFSKNLLAYAHAQRLFIYPLRYLRDPQTGMETNAFLDEPSFFPLPFERADYIAVNEVTDSEATFAVASGNSLYFTSREERETLMGGKELVREFSRMLDLGEAVAGMSFYPGNQLVVVLRSGKSFLYDFKLQVKETFQNPSPVSVVGSLFGDRGLCLGGKDGTLCVWAQATSPQGRKFYLIHHLPPMPAAVTGLTFNERDRSFFAWDETGNLFLYYSTSEALRLKLRRPAGQRFSLNIKGDYLLEYGTENTLFHIDNHHADVDLKTLFAKIWYEGYPAPAYVWQSTGGTQDFEPKLSLVPLILGTLKGALYAMFFALPLALTGALFMNQFLHPDLHRLIKPVIEMMAGLPSVIIGFLAGLWLAPLLEEYLPGILLACLVIPAGTILTGLALEKKFFKRGQDLYKSEIFLFIPFTLILVWACLKATPLMDQLLFQGDFKQFFFKTLQSPYDQRNALVVGFAMGFAVIPIIFSLTEDALSFVPKEMIAGSLGLGLSRWQTATGIVLKAAGSGILSAVMVGLGRAIGETMIVLMATGNTPILSFSPFNGFRTLSANIAVELPEAPVGGSLYRILFLTSFLLFLFTFLINTLTDLLKERWQRKLRGA